MRRLWMILCLLLVPCLPNLSAFAQDNPNFEIGMKSYGSYLMGNIDQVTFSNGSLGVDIPLISYPQRGGKLKLDFSLHYFNGAATSEQTCYPPNGCSSSWSFSQAAFGLLDKGAVFGAITIAAIGEGDGATHPTGLVNGSATSVESLDVSAYQAALNTTQKNYFTSITDSRGVVYQGATQTCYLGFPGISNINVSSLEPCELARSDSNGNAINFSTTGWTDTLGRAIPLPTQSTSPSDFTGCTGTQPVSFVVLWNPPGISGGTYPLKFCFFTATYPQVITSVQLYQGQYLTSYSPYNISLSSLESIVLPNGTAWTFGYLILNLQPSAPDPEDLPTLSQIAFPTGGTLSYTWTTTETCPTGGTPVNFGVATRTMNPADGVTPVSTWTYTYGTLGGNPASGTTFVTDPAGNDSVHTFNLPVNQSGYPNSCYPYETQAEYFQGSHTSGTLLKTVNTAYSFYVPPVNGTFTGQALNVVPTQVGTVWANGQQNQVVHAYDSGFQAQLLVVNPNVGVTTYGSSFSATYGNELSRQDYDYGSGAPGPLLRTTSTNYLAFSNSSYLNGNLLALPSSVQVTGSGPGSYTTYGYDESGSPQGAHGNLTSVHRWQNTTNGYLVTNNVYNSNGLLTSSTDPKGNPTTYVYSGSYAGSGPTSVANALSQTTTYAYDFNTGLLNSTTDPNTRTTGYQYDNMLRTTQINKPDGGQTTFSYPNPNQVNITEKISSSLDRLSYLLVDGVGRETRQAVTNGESLPYDEIDTCYDGNGRVSFKSYPFQDSGPFATSRTCTSPELGDSFAYDALSRTLSVSHSDANSVISTSYSGNTTTVTDEQARTRESFVDGLGRLTQVVENPGALNYVTNYSYDALDNLTSVVQNGSRNRAFAYDSLSRLTSSTNPESNWSPASLTSVATTYSYDADGNLVNKIEPAQNQQSTSLVTLTYCYDALNRMTAKGYSAQTCTGGTMPTPVATYAYDGNAPSGCSVGSFGYGLAIGKHTAMCDAAGSEAWAYSIVSGVGWQTTNQRTTNGVTRTSVYQGDLLGSPLSIQYPSGRTINYTPNAADRPTSATDGGGLNYASNAHYAANGTQCWAVLGGVTTVSETLNSRLQPNQMQAINSVVGYSGSCPGLGQTGNLLDLSYNFNLGSGDNGNVMGIVNNRDTTRSQAFTYDALNRLSQATASTYAVSPAHCWGESYQYDNQPSGGAWGNFTAIGVASSSYNGCTQESLSLSVDSNNRINSSGYGYDTAGNMIIAPPAGTAYTFNAENQMTQAVTSSSTGYVYDGDGKRVEKTSGGTASKLYWYDVTGNVLDETDGSGSVTDGNLNEYIFFNGKRIARRTD